MVHTGQFRRALDLDFSCYFVAAQIDNNFQVLRYAVSHVLKSLLFSSPLRMAAGQARD
jgi:hypothetical protein